MITENEHSIVLNIIFGIVLIKLGCKLGKAKYGIRIEGTLFK